MGCKQSKVGVMSSQPGDIRPHQRKEKSFEKTFSHSDNEYSSHTVVNNDQQLVINTEIAMKRLKMNNRQSSHHPNRRESYPKAVRAKPQPAVIMIEKQTSDPVLLSSFRTNRSVFSAQIADDGTTAQGNIEENDEFHNRKYWFMQNETFRRETSFNSIDLGVIIAKELKGTPHEKKIMQLESKTLKSINNNSNTIRKASANHQPIQFTSQTALPNRSARPHARCVDLNGVNGEVVSKSQSQSPSTQRIH